MKQLLSIAALFLFSVTPAIADPVADIRNTALKDTLALELVEGLTTEIGPRLAGTEAEARARAWGIKKLTALGFKNIRIEPFEMPVWVRGAETATLIAPYPQTLKITALGNSGATSERGLTADVVGFDSVEALKAADPTTVRGKIVFVTHRMTRTQDGSSYGPFGAPRRQGPSIASKMGAAAIVIRSIGTDHSRSPHTGVQTWATGVTPIPAGALSVVDAELLERILSRGKPVRMTLTLTPRQIGVRQSGNVIAEIPGSDPKAGIVLIGGHLDSWDLGTGAVDDGAGIAITTAAAKRILDRGATPRRTIRLVWFGAEEVGLFGGIAYAKTHGNEAHALAAESDFGADRIWRFDTALPESAAPVADRLRIALAPLGIAPGLITAEGGPDMSPLMALGRTAAIDLQQDGTRYFDLHHTPEDTFDKIDPAQLAQNVAAWASMLTIVANAPENLMIKAQMP
jgi:carboxypeptidase Q